MKKKLLEFKNIIVKKNTLILEKPKLSISKDFIYLQWKNARVYWLKWTPKVIKDFDLKVDLDKKTLKFKYIGLWETDKKDIPVKYQFTVKFLNKTDFQSALNTLSIFTRKFKAVSSIS